MSRANPLTPFLERQGVVVLDGGLATELEARGVHLEEELWSARVLIDDPERIVEVHRAYLEAGADCIVSSGYQATVEGFVRWGLSEAEAWHLLRRSVELAVVARDAFWEERPRQGVQDGGCSERLRPLVAAGVGPYGAFLADGSEYTGHYGLEIADLYGFHAPRWRELASSGADLMACETIPNRKEACALARLVAETPEVPAWISFSCPDGHHLADGDDLQATVAEIDQTPGLIAIGVNCLAPSLVEGLLRQLREVTDKPLLAYPNSGEAWDAQNKCWREGSRGDDLSTFALRWRAAGACLMGGCCRTGPEEIRRLRRVIIDA